MNKVAGTVLGGVCLLALTAASSLVVSAQTSEVKEKAPMYSYVGFWNIPRAQWADMEKSNATDRPVLDKAVAAGTIVGYGDDVNLVHQPDGYTHDEWWSAMSIAGR